MTRRSACGRTEAMQRAKVARAYLDAAELAATETLAEARNVAAGNAVLAAIAASDAICCLRLGRRNRSDRHGEAIELLASVRPGGAKLASDMTTVISAKDPAHYGDAFVGEGSLKATLRAASRLVAAAEAMVSGQ